MSKNSEALRFLKEAGYEVEIVHERPLEGVSIARDWAGDPMIVRGHFGEPIMCNRYTRRADYELLKWRPNGGHTRVRIFKGDSLLVEGFAMCSELDNFNRHLGLTIALGRALKAMKANGVALDAVS